MNVLHSCYVLGALKLLIIQDGGSEGILTDEGFVQIFPAPFRLMLYASILHVTETPF